MKHVLWITAAIVFVGLCTLLPFLPGSYDRFPMTLEPSGEAYNVFFEQPSFRLGTQEIVMYNPRGEHMMIGHAMDRLTPRPLLNGGGFYAVHETAQPRWKYFWFD